MNLNIAMSLDDEFPRCYAIRGFIGLKKAKYDKIECKSDVLDDLSKAIELYGNNDQSYTSYIYRAEYYLYTNDLDNAHSDLEKALSIYRRNGRACFFMAIYYKMQGDSQEYERYLTKSKEYNFLPEANDY